MLQSGMQRITGHINGKQILLIILHVLRGINCHMTVRHTTACLMTGRMVLHPYIIWIGEKNTVIRQKPIYVHVCGKTDIYHCT